MKLQVKIISKNIGYNLHKKSIANIDKRHQKIKRILNGIICYRDRINNAVLLYNLTKFVHGQEITATVAILLNSLITYFTQSLYTWRELMKTKNN